MSGTKLITNHANRPVEVTLIIRNGDNPAGTWGTQVVNLGNGESREVTYGTASNIIYLNGLGLKSGGLYQEQRVETRGDSFDNVLNMNSKIEIKGIAPENVAGTN